MNKQFQQVHGILFLLLITVYFPFILDGGFGPTDDLALVADSKLGGAEDSEKGFHELLSGSLARSSNVSRPIYGLIEVFTQVTFGDNPVPYNILKLVLWFSIVAALSYTVRMAIGTMVSWIFFLFASLPIFSSSHIFASFQMGYLLSVLFWSFSLILLHRFILRRKKSNYYLSYCCVLLALLSCEIILPLLAVTALLPIVYECYKQEKRPIGDLLGVGRKFIFPVIILSLGFFIFKVYISKLYQSGEGTYGLSPVTTKSFFQGGYYLFTLVAEVPLMLIAVISHLLQWETILVSILIILFFIFLRKNDNDLSLQELNLSRERIEKLFIGIVLFSLVACVSIFILSGYPAVTFGNYNKMLLPSFLLVCILLAWGIAKLLMTRWIVAVIGVSILWTSSMVVQVRNFSDSWKIREKVLYDCANKINTTDLGIQPHVIACVPFFSKKNYNNEHVFWLSWDFFYGLKLYGSKKISSAFPFCWQTLVNPDYYSLHNINRHITELPEHANLWYYEFDLSTNKSVLRKIENHAALEKQFGKVFEKRINYHPFILRQQIRMKLKKWILETHFL